MTKRHRSRQPDRPSMDWSPDAPLDRDWPDRDWPDRDWPDGDWPDGDLLDGDLLDGDPARWQPVAQVLAALTSAPESSELTGEARALAEFRAFAVAAPRGARLPPPAPRRDPGWMAWLPGRRPAAAAATGAVLMGGLLAVAYAGDLPVAAQRLAHSTIDAPRPDPAPAASSPAAGPAHPAGRAGHRAADGPAGPDRRVHSGSVSGHPGRPGSSSSPGGHSAGRLGPGRLGPGRLGAGHLDSASPGAGPPGQSGPGRSAGPVPTWGPSPSASSSPPADPAPSPSAAPSPSQSGPPSAQQSPSSPPGTPP